jgi:hypothetical protein
MHYVCYFNLTTAYYDSLHCQPKTNYSQDVRTCLAYDPFKLTGMKHVVLNSN